MVQSRPNVPHRAWFTAGCLVLCLAAKTAGARDDLDPQPWQHHNNAAMLSLLSSYAERYPGLAQVYSVGKSELGVDLRVLRVTHLATAAAAPTDEADVGSGCGCGDQPDVSLLRPAVKWVANMHGNEVLGREMMVAAVRDLLEGYGKDARVTRLLNTTDIHIMPSMNPDGYAAARPSDCSNKDPSDADVIGRYSASGVDMNRDFPDQYDSRRPRSPEVQAVIKWIDSEWNFALSANLHGGSLVANYPYDGTADGSSVENRSPDDSLFKVLAATYANAHATMHTGDATCPNRGHTFFEDGITNGAAWYAIRGGMQDYNYLHAGCLEITLELGCCKFPPAAVLQSEWERNRPAFLAFSESAHRGVVGFIISARNGAGIRGATINVKGIYHPVYSRGRGLYRRLLLPGQYEVIVQARGYVAQIATVHVEEPGPDVRPAMRVDFTLDEIEETTTMIPVATTTFPVTTTTMPSPNTLPSTHGTSSTATHTATLLTPATAGRTSGDVARTTTVGTTSSRTWRTAGVSTTIEAPGAVPSPSRNPASTTDIPGTTTIKASTAAAVGTATAVKLPPATLATPTFADLETQTVTRVTKQAPSGHTKSHSAEFTAGVSVGITAIALVTACVIIGMSRRRRRHRVLSAPEAPAFDNPAFGLQPMGKEGGPTIV